jgi:phage terminase large subunit-like protein
VDPSGTSTGDRTGIVVCGLGVDGHGYVLADWSLRASPDEWARRVAQAYHAFQADEVVCETNYGADLAISVLKQADPDVRVRKVTATRGKSVRAAPVALKYERGEVHHMAGAGLEQLEDELVLFNADGQPIDPSPDRADACIWALTALLTATRSRFAFVGADVPPSPEGAAVSDQASAWPLPGRGFFSGESLRSRFHPI